MTRGSIENGSSRMIAVVGVTIFSLIMLVGGLKAIKLAHSLPPETLVFYNVNEGYYATAGCVADGKTQAKYTSSPANTLNPDDPLLHDGTVDIIPLKDAHARKWRDDISARVDPKCDGLIVIDRTLYDVAVAWLWKHLGL